MRFKKLSVSNAMFLYWIGVIVWQTVRPVGNRSIIDIGVKLGFFALICLYGWLNRKPERSGYVQLALVFFVLTQLVTYFSDPLTLSTVITAIYMIVQIILYLILLYNASVSHDELRRLGRNMVIAALVMSAYSMIFDFNQFIKLFGDSGAYGSECKSFLYSNHEYAVYLSIALVFIIWELLNEKKNRVWLLIITAVLFVNLMTTYSRTAILGVLAALAVFLFYYNKKYFAAFVVLFTVFLIIAFNNDTLYDFVFNKIFKESMEQTGGIVDAGRQDMYVVEWNFFRSASLIQKIFGRGYASGGASGGHDAYLYILNVGGIVMLAFFALVIAWSLRNSYKVYKLNRKVSALCFGLQIFALVYMVAQTPILFFSSMDSYFITMIAVMIPLYAHNYAKMQVKSPALEVKHENNAG